MTVNPTGRKRLKPMIVKTGWFKREVVFVAQEEVRVVDTYYSPDPDCITSRDVDYLEWRNKSTIEEVDNEATTRLGT